MATGYAWGLTRWDCSWWVEGQEWFTVGIGGKRAVGREILAPRREGSMDGAEFWLQSAEMKTLGTGGLMHGWFFTEGNEENGAGGDDALELILD